MKRVALLVFCAVLCARGETRQAVVRLAPTDTNSGDDRFIAFTGWDAAVYRIAPDSVVHPLALGIHGKWATLQGSTGPAVSADDRWIAFTQNHDLWLCDTSSGACSQTTSLGQPATWSLASVDVLITAWSANSRELLLHVTAGETELADVDVPELKVRKAPYGFYRFKMAEHSLELLKVPDNFEFEAWLPNGEFIGSLEPILPEQTCRENPLVIVREGASAIPIDANAAPGRLSQVAVSSDGISAAMSVQCSRSNFSQIVRFDLENRAFSSVSAKGEYAEYQWPRFSPSARQLTWIRSRHAEGKLAQDTLILDDKPIYECITGIDYSWIDNSRIGLICGSQVIVIDSTSGKELSKTQINRGQVPD